MRIVSAIAASTLLLGGSVSAQAPVPNPTNKTGVIGLMHAIHSTNDVDKTLAFYQAVFGVGGQVRPFASTGPQILTNSPGATLRVAMTQLKGGFNFELTEFGNVERQMHKQPDIADPGAPMMKILVRDLDAIVASAKKVNAPIVTRSGAPVTVPTSAGNAKAIIMRDPDGYFVEAIQGTPAADSPEGSIIGAIMGLTVRDMDESLKVLERRARQRACGRHEVLERRGDARSDGPAERRVVPHGRRPDLGQQGAHRVHRDQRRTRKSFDLRVTDANACGMAIRVGHIRELLAKIKANGGRVLSRDGQLVEWSDTVRNVFVKDPNGLNLELVGSADPNL